MHFPTHYLRVSVQRVFARAVYFRSDDVDDSNLARLARVDRLEPEEDERGKDRNSDASPQRVLDVESGEIAP